MLTRPRIDTDRIANSRRRAPRVHGHVSVLENANKSFSVKKGMAAKSQNIVNGLIGQENRTGRMELSVTHDVYRRVQSVSNVFGTVKLGGGCYVTSS